MGSDKHTYYMNRCLELAGKGLGSTGANPMVGSVIVYRDRIIGEGYHQKFGENHAEVNAIGAVKDKDLLKDSTLYVNLEPCSHHGKTPPCSDLIIRMEIPRVVIGTVDPNAVVAGRGIKKMKQSGIKVEVGFLEKECRFLNRRFFTFHEKKRPYIILKWAQSADGFIDVLRDRETPIGPYWISGPYERMLVHKWRSEEMSILVGTNTVEKDDPSLNVRDWVGNSPQRFIIDRTLRLDKSLKLLNGSFPSGVFTEKEEISGSGYNTIRIDFNKNIWPQIMEYLYDHELVSVLIEGGGKTINSLITSGLWDEARVFTGQKNFKDGVRAPVIHTKPAHHSKAWKTELRIYYKNNF
jgi:diaminohydroxyphosphoribosylaminopyrimidine deaminase/5-amino-6-(5-phosphoribosylamino)uracil reductase